MSAARCLPGSRRVNRLRNILTRANVGTHAALGREGSDYVLYGELGNGRWWRQVLAYDATAGETHHSMWKSRLGVPMTSVDDTNATYFTFTGTWSTTSSGPPYGGSARFSIVAGDTATYVTDAAVTALGLHIETASNGGLARVSLDGDRTAATLLPTAQQLVDAGTFPNTILVANGGTLNPTDRVIDYYTSTQVLDTLLPLAVGLAAAQHTVVITVTGYKRAAASAARVFVAGGLQATAATSVDTAGMSLAVLTTLLENSSVFEYAISFTPTGGSQVPFIGNRHGNDIEDTFTLSVDGATVTPSDGTITVGSTVSAHRTSHLLHPEAVGSIATSDCTWTMTAAGLRVHWFIDWLQAGTVSSSYVAMLPTQGNNLAMGTTGRGAVVGPLTADDNSVNGDSRSPSAVLWENGGHAAIGAFLLNPAVALDNFTHATGSQHIWLQDRTAGDFNKAYYQRIGSSDTAPIAAGDHWESDILYVASYLPDASVLAAA